MNYVNKQLVDMRLEKDTYTLSVAIKKAFLEEWETYGFILTQRYSGEIESVPYERASETTDFICFDLTISTANHAFFQAHEMIDLSIIRKREDEEKRSRIQSNYDYIELLQTDLGNGRMVHPFTTKAGNITFNIRENYLFARVDHAEIANTGMLTLHGIYHHGGVKQEQIRKVELVMTTRIAGEETLLYAAKQIDLPDTYRDRPWYDAAMHNGFQANVDLKPHMTIGQANYLKFYVRIYVERDGKVEMLQSGRMKANPNRSDFPIKQKYKLEASKIQVICRPTKKSKFLSVRLGQYKFIRESVHSARRKWVELRRSKRVLNMYKVVFFVLGKLNRKDQKLVIFESFHGKQFSDSPRAIYEYMQEHRPGYKLIWSADRRHVNSFREKGIPHVRRFSVNWLFLMTSAKYWVTNARLPLWIPKPKRTEYVQTWHGTPLKRLAADMEEVHMPGTNAERYKQNFLTEAAKWDYLVSPNAYSTKIFKRAFQFDKHMLETGYPRNDYLYLHNNQQSMDKIKKQLGIDLDKKVILYAPTWRDNQFYRRGQYKFNLQLDLEKLQQQFGETHVIILRMHYLVAENLDITAYEGFVYDCSHYEDIRDLYLISDVLITDYSSVFFDFANLRRPMMFFVYDIEDYRDNLRGFYFDFEAKAPGPLVKTTDSLIQELHKIEENGFQPTENFNAFMERFCYLEDGEASKRVVDTVFPS